MLDRESLLFSAEVSVRYHRRRATFLDRTSAIMSLLIIVGGSTAFASLFGASTTFAKGATIFLSSIGGIQLVFRIDRAAVDHQRWLKQWLEMLAAMRASESPTKAQLGRWETQRCSIESECVGEMRALQVDCYNRTLVALSYEDQPTSMRWWHRAFIQILSFEKDFANPNPKPF